MACLGKNPKMLYKDKVSWSDLALRSLGVSEEISVSGGKEFLII
jgi:hypothetical protein